MTNPSWNTPEGSKHGTLATSLLTSPSVAVARLRAEYKAAVDPQAKVLLLYELGLLLEHAAEDTGAARDYLTAFHLVPDFREPLEALIALLHRRRSVKNLGKLLDALVRAAATPEEAARARVERATFWLEHQGDPKAAKETFKEAVVERLEEGAAWLELEILAGKEHDIEARQAALEERIARAEPPAWRTLLMLDLAAMQARSGELDRAAATYRAAAAPQGPMRFYAHSAFAEFARREHKDEWFAEALEAQARLAKAALQDASGTATQETGVPGYVRSEAFVADALLRAARARRISKDLRHAADLLEQAAEMLPHERIIAYERLALTDALGQVEESAKQARALLNAGATGPEAASLWLRVEEGAAAQGDRDAALAALGAAVQADPACIPTRAMQLDLLSTYLDPQEAPALAAALESAADHMGSEEAKGRMYLRAAWEWALGARDTAGAKVALSQARALGVPPLTVARLTGLFASLHEDDAAYEEAVRRIIAAGAPESEQASLWFELGRTRLLRHDREGASKAWDSLAFAPSGAWLGRVLQAYALPLLHILRASAVTADTREQEATATREQETDAIDTTNTELEAGAENLSEIEDEETDEGDAGFPQNANPRKRRSQEAFRGTSTALEALAGSEHDAELAHALRLTACLRAQRADDLQEALTRLRTLFEEDASDVLTASTLTQLLRQAGEPKAAASVLQTSAAALSDAPLAAALHLEAGFLLWKHGERTAAIEPFRAARASAPKAALAPLLLALRALEADNPEARRHVLELALESGEDPALIALEQFALEVRSGSHPDDIRAALEELEQQGTDELRLAATLARLTWPGAADHLDHNIEPALRALEKSSTAGAALAYGERARLARDRDKSPMDYAHYAASWAATEPSMPAALEWLAASQANDDHAQQIAAHRLIATFFEGEAQCAQEAQAAAVALLTQANEHPPLLAPTHAPAQLLNLELAPVGSDPRRRSAALRGLGPCLGEEASLDALGLAGWSDLALGEAKRALDAFRRVTQARPQDIGSWEGVRAAAMQLQDANTAAAAAAKLGELCSDNLRAADFWEQAGFVWLDITHAPELGEQALRNAFARDPQRYKSFDRLFRRVRERGENDALLELIARRLEVAENTDEIVKLNWERARVLRKKGDQTAALEALHHVTLLEPDHVGALALSSEIFIKRGAYAEAAEALARLATLTEAPAQQRLISGSAAADLYEKRLQDPQKAFDVLIALHRERLSTLPVRERLSALGLKVGAWRQTAALFEELMRERDASEGRVDAARCAMMIWRDHLEEPDKAQGAALKLLEEVPYDSEALSFTMHLEMSEPARTQTLETGKAALVQLLTQEPSPAEQYTLDPDRVALLAELVRVLCDWPLRQAALGCLVALGRDEPDITEELSALDQRVAKVPQIQIDARALGHISDPLDSGPLVPLFEALGDTITEALGPSKETLGVGRKERVDPRAGLSLRNEVAAWAGALGLGDFELYIGGRNPNMVQGVAGEPPALVLGSAITSPLSAASRQAIAREVFALRRGITVLRTRDEATVASIVVAACNVVDLRLEAPAYAMLGDVQRQLGKALSRRVKKMLPDLCQQVVASRPHLAVWVEAAQRSLDRMAALAAGDVSLVLADVLGITRATIAMKPVLEVPGPHRERTQRLLRFVLSPSYLALRKNLGMGVR